MEGTAIENIFLWTMRAFQNTRKHHL